ncbi:MAG: hypothetical protein OEW87_00780 [Flavobacteriaceae bacterium]|nr:hypothetical protein [Flavobacteriaceae bacterium]
MSLTNFCQAEYRRLKKIQNYQYLLPNYFKKVGIGLLILSLITLISRKYLFDDGEMLRQIAKKGMLLSLLLITISKEKIEDELIIKLRGQAFAFAFVAGVIYTLIQPIINYIVALVIRPEKAVFDGLEDFIILWFMMVMYLTFFYLFKRYR